MSEGKSAGIESTLAYIKGNNESVVLVNQIVAELRQLKQTQNTVEIDAVLTIISNAWLKHTGTGRVVADTLGNLSK